MANTKIKTPPYLPSFFGTREIGKVILEPCNEGQEMNYREEFTGTAEQIITRSLSIIRGLESIFSCDSFSVKVVNRRLLKTIQISQDMIVDEKGQVLFESSMP